MKISLDKLEIAAREKPVGYLDAVMSAGRLTDDGFLEMSSISYLRLCARFRQFGDAVEMMAKPVARAIRMPCLDSGGGLKRESPCAKRRDAMNSKPKPLT